MSEHVMFKDHERRMLVCAKCRVPWPCTDKKNEILKDIKRRAEALRQQP